MLSAWMSMAPVAAQQSQEQMAAYYYDNGEFEQAAQLYESLYKNYANKYYYQRLYSSYLKLGEFKDALRLAEKRLYRMRATDSNACLDITLIRC